MVLGSVRVLAHVEIEAFAVAHLVAAMEAGEMAPSPIWTDLTSFPLDLIRARPDGPVVDIITGGYPCQPFSHAGRRLGESDHRNLWPHIRGIVEVARPWACLFENVEGHVSLGLRDVLADLARIGYRVDTDGENPTWGLFSAAEVGAPHIRKRVFILAYREGVGLERLGASGYEACGAKTICHGMRAWPARPGEHQHPWEEPRGILDV